MKAIRLIILIAAVAIFGFGTGCGPYTFNPSLPGHIKTVSIPIFKNPRTFKYGAEKTITDAVIDAFIDDGTLDVVEEGTADSKLVGEIVSYRREAMRYDVNELIQEYNLAIILSLTYRDMTSGEIIWQEKSLYSSITYYPIETSAGPAETEDEALDRLAEETAEKIVTRTLQNW